MTSIESRKHLHPRGARRPRFASVSPFRRKKGAGKAGCRLHPRSCTQKSARVDHRFNRIIRLSPPNGLRLIGDLLGEPCTLATVALRISDASSPVELETSPHDLTPAWGRRDHTISPSAPVSPKLSPDLVRIRPVSSKQLAASSVYTPHAAHEVHLALRLQLRARRCRVHRIPPRVS